MNYTLVRISEAIFIVSAILKASLVLLEKRISHNLKKILYVVLVSQEEIEMQNKSRTYKEGFAALVI